MLARVLPSEEGAGAMLAWWLPLMLMSSAPGQTLPEAVSAEVRAADFVLTDADGKRHPASDWRDRPLLAVVFLGVDCPLARLYAPRLAELSRAYDPRGVAFLAVDANAHDSPAELARFARENALPFPFLRDEGNAFANRLGATRTPEVFLLDARRVVRYRGRIDDQYAVGVRRAAPTRRDLADALDDLLAGRPVRRPRTTATGCAIDRARRAADGGPITYCRDVAPVLNKHCVSCHRPGQIAPFSLLTYRDAADWAETIRDVVRQRRMPLWYADPHYGRFANDPSLSDEERRLLDGWVAAGVPEGNPADLAPPPTFPGQWSIPGPDWVVSIPQPVTVPAEGVMDYQLIEVDPGFREDRWVRAVEIRPGNRAVVHHCNVYLLPPGSHDAAAQGELGSVLLAATTLGTPPLVLPDGMAKRVPAGWKFLFVLHYTPVGTVQTDRTSMGLTFADPATVRKEVATRILLDDALCIPPGCPDHRVEKFCRMERDVLLLALFPHMHLRGRSFRYEATYPDGRTEILLDVPRYDFAWQDRYVLAEPKRLPAGTVLRGIAHYDNSADNPANPDPAATVRAGPQNTDEMFNGYYEVALADQDLTRPPALGERTRLMGLGAAVAILGGALLLLRFAGRLRPRG
ncbi:MAG TPA: redoxin family protein [Gemmataceae bacterium]|nr:redoxin family protein [Gemmataceae bacterium]